jgi:hypothetical protein
MVRTKGGWAVTCDDCVRKREPGLLIARYVARANDVFYFRVPLPDGFQVLLPEAELAALDREFDKTDDESAGDGAVTGGEA